MRQLAFLDAFGRTASITDAARSTGIARIQHYRWMESSPEYAAAFRKSIEIACGVIEDEIVSRALKGVFEPNVFQGRFTYPQEEYVVKDAVIGPRGAIREPEVRAWRDKPGAKPLGVWRKSDYALGLLARGWMPHKYRQAAQVEVSGPGGGPLEIVERLNAGRERARRLALADREKAEEAQDDAGRG